MNFTAVVERECTYQGLKGVKWFFCYTEFLISVYYIIIPVSVLPLMIILISVFGKFEEHYRWFILNQAIFEIIFLSYSQICFFDNIGQIDIGNLDIGNCFGKEYDFANWDAFFMPTPYAILFFIINHIEKVTFFTVLFLTIVRFYCLYFPLSYKKIFTKKSIGPIIILWDILAILSRVFCEILSPTRNTLWVTCTSTS